MAKQIATQTTVFGVCRIGRSGTKTHPCARTNYVYTDGTTGYTLDPVCSCGGTQNGHAHASGFWEGSKATCKNAR